MLSRGFTSPIMLLGEDPILFVLLALSLVISISSHEFSHAYIAHRLGDDTAKYLGRVTLNPASHLDPIGTLFILFIGFGWGKPVPFNPFNLKNPKRDGALIALAGPASNFLLAVTFAILINFLNYTPIFSEFLYLVTFYNLVLGLFNLIPVHPLDGFKIVNGMLPENLSVQWLQLAPYGVPILLLLMLTGATSTIINPVLNFLLVVLGLAL